MWKQRQQVSCTQHTACVHWYTIQLPFVELSHLSSLKGNSLRLPTTLHLARTQPSSTSLVILRSSSLGQDSRAEQSQRESSISTRYPLTLLWAVEQGAQQTVIRRRGRWGGEERYRGEGGGRGGGREGGKVGGGRVERCVFVAAHLSCSWSSLKLPWNSTSSLYMP